MFHFVFRLTVCSPAAWLEVGKKSSNRSDRRCLFPRFLQELTGAMVVPVGGAVFSGAEAKAQTVKSETGKQKKRLKQATDGGCEHGTGQSNGEWRFQDAIARNGWKRRQHSQKAKDMKRP